MPLRAKDFIANFKDLLEFTESDRDFKFNSDEYSLTLKKSSNPDFLISAILQYKDSSGVDQGKRLRLNQAFLTSAIDTANTGSTYEVLRQLGRKRKTKTFGDVVCSVVQSDNTGNLKALSDTVE